MAMQAKLRYLVQLADHYEFDFGGENGGVAAFCAKGDAILHAQELRRRSGKAVRVLDTAVRQSPEVFMAAAEVATPVAAAPQSPAVGLQSYYPEMGEPRPEAQIDASLAHYGEHYFLKTPLVLSGRGIKHTGTLSASQLVPSAQHKAGWHTYKVTMAAFEKICEKYAVASESML